MKIIADTNTFLAVTLYEPERDSIIRLTVGHDLVAPNILPFEIGNLFYVTYSSVSRNVSLIRERFLKDKALKQYYNKIKSQIKM
jgi:hypothetical protein